MACRSRSSVKSQWRQPVRIQGRRGAMIVDLAAAEEAASQESGGLMPEFVIRPARPVDEPGAYHVCLKTGNHGQDGEPFYQEDPDALGRIYVGRTWPSRPISRSSLRTTRRTTRHLRLCARRARLTGVLCAIRGRVAAGPVPALSRAGRRSRRLDSCAAGGSHLPPSRLFLSRALRDVSFSPAYRLVASRAGSWLRPADARRGHGEARPPRLSRRAPRREPAEWARARLLRAAGFP